MKKDKHIKKELEEQSDFLGEMLDKRKGGFKVPDGYFDNLSERILDNVGSEDSSASVVHIGDTTSNNRITTKKRPFAWLAVAASVALIVVAGFWMINPQQEANDYAKLETLNEAEVLEHLDNMDDLDFNDLLASGIVTEADLDFNDISYFSDEDEDIYINAILEQDLEEI